MKVVGAVVVWQRESIATEVTCRIGGIKSVFTVERLVHIAHVVDH